MAIVREKKRAMVQALLDRHVDAFAQAGVVTINGEGRFLEAKKLEVRNGEQVRIISGDIVIINVGTTAHIPDITGLRSCSPLTHVEALELNEVPEHLIILGGGYVGLEFAQMMRRFGASVSVVERHDRILNHEDEGVSTELMEMLVSGGINFHLPTQVNGVEGLSGDEIRVHVVAEGKHVSIVGTHILCATGRVPNTAGIGLPEAGIRLTEKGYIVVDEHFRTSVEGVFAVSECVGSPHFTHVSIDDGRIVKSLFTDGATAKSAANRLVPSTLFTSPKLAHVGAREQELKPKRIPYRLGKIVAGSLLHNLATGETQGFLKIMIGAGDEILGFTALTAQAGEMLLPIQMGMLHGLPYIELANALICHPTYSEGLSALLATVPKRV